MEFREHSHITKWGNTSSIELHEICSHLTAVESNTAVWSPLFEFWDFLNSFQMIVFDFINYMKIFSAHLLSKFYISKTWADMIYSFKSILYYIFMQVKFLMGALFIIIGLSYIRALLWFFCQISSCSMCALCFIILWQETFHRIPWNSARLQWNAIDTGLVVSTNRYLTLLVSYNELRVRQF